MHLPRPNILIVDDEPNVLLTVDAILQQEGYATTALPNGNAAIEAIRRRHYDLVLTDLKMPGVDGLAVLEEVRKSSPDTVTIMMTGYASVDSAVEALQAGAYEYLLKPTDVNDLKAAVRRSLERKQLSEIDTLYRISRKLTALDAGQIKAEVSQAVMRVLNVAHAAVVACDRGGAPAFSADCENPLSALLRNPRVLERMAAGTAVLNDADETWAGQPGLASFALVPGVANERLVCILVASNGAAPYDFHASALRFLQGVANQSALALANASLVSELQTNNRELEAANEKLRELDKLKSQFLSIATHELRTPLSIILGYNAMLEESLADRLTPEENETLRESVQACKRLIRLVNSMLDISQIESGKMRMNFSYADLRQIASGVATLFQQEARRRGIGLSLEMPPRIPRVFVDAERIEQVLVNLVGNALKFTARGTITIHIRPRPEECSIEIAVSDTGVGISPDDQQHLFDEFVQLRGQMERRQRDGSGLGLAIAKRIIEAHQGQIRVESVPGQGSTFSFLIPLRNSRASTEAVSA